MSALETTEPRRGGDGTSQSAMAGGLKNRGTLPGGIPLLEVCGAAPGPVLAVTAGIHGDEYEGVRAIYELFDEIDANQIRGTLRMVPVANPRAHRAVSRTNPADSQNLARVFPGRETGTESERTASALAREIIESADFYVDLHSGGVKYAMPSMAGYWLGDPKARAAAMAFGAPVVWGHPVIEEGRTISVAKERGIPFLYVEAWGAGRIRPQDLRMMKRGILNLSVHLGMRGGTCDIPDAPLSLIGVGNTDDGVNAGADGFLLQSVELLDTVREGQTLARLVDLHGVEIERYTAPCNGVVALTHELPVVEKGDTLFLLAAKEA